MSEAAHRDFRQRGGVADLSDRVKLRFTGADRVRYLNGQVTANVTKLAAGQSLPACVTTAKGRLCAEIFLHKLPDALVVDADPALRETLSPRLERYIIADDVTVEDLSDDWKLVHVTTDPGEHATRALACDRATRFGPTGWDLLLTPEAFAELWPLLAEKSAVLDPALQELLRIEAGIPRWGQELTEDTLPPEAGLERTHIDYHKGCYIGQEVISRLKSVGHVNRHLTGFVSPSGTPLPAGASLFLPEGGEKPVGVLTSAADSFALEKPIALGYLKRGTASPELVARPADGPEVVVAVHALPFVS